MREYHQPMEEKLQATLYAIAYCLSKGVGWDFRRSINAHEDFNDIVRLNKYYSKPQITRREFLLFPLIKAKDNVSREAEMLVRHWGETIHGTIEDKLFQYVNTMDFELDKHPFSDPTERIIFYKVVADAIIKYEENRESPAITTESRRCIKCGKHK